MQKTKQKSKKANAKIELYQLKLSIYIFIRLPVSQERNTQREKTGDEQLGHNSINLVLLFKVSNISE